VIGWVVRTPSGGATAIVNRSVTPLVKSAVDEPWNLPPTMRLPAPLTAGALSKLPVLLSEPGGNTRRLVDRWFARSRLTLKPAMSLDNVEAIRKLVHAELGCAVIPAIAVRRASERRQLVVCSLSPRLSRTLAVVIRRDRQLTPGMRETRRALLALTTAAA